MALPREAGGGGLLVRVVEGERRLARHNHALALDQSPAIVRHNGRSTANRIANRAEIQAIVRPCESGLRPRRGSETARTVNQRGVNMPATQTKPGMVQNRNYFLGARPGLAPKPG